MAGVRDRGLKVGVVGVVGRLAELEVHRDLLGASLDQVVDHARVVATRERKVRVDGRVLVAK